MKRIALAAITLLVACTPSVKGPTTAPTQVHPLFDPAATPPKVPAPNDLGVNPATGFVALPVSSSSSAADKEVAAYFAGLNGFAADTAATSDFDGALDPTTVTTSDVLVWDVTDPSAPAAVTGYLVTSRANPLGPAPYQVDITPPLGGWTASHDYAVVFIAGSSGMQGTGGTPVVGTPAWLLVRQKNPLVKCSGPGLTGTCKPTTNLITSSAKDLNAQAAEESANAVALEQVRLAYAPLFAAVEAQGVSRDDVPLLWTFRILNQTFLGYNPAGASPVVPLPNDIAIDPTTGLVKAPVDPRTSLANQEFTTTYVNTLNGFPLVAAGAAQIVGPDTLDATTVDGSSVIVLDLTPTADGGTAIPPLVMTSYVSATNQIVIQPPSGAWTRGHHYVVAVVGGSGGVKGSTGGPVLADIGWTLLSGSAPLLDCAVPAPSCHSTVSLLPLSNEDAITLETARQALAPVITDIVNNTAASREDLLAVWTFQVLKSEEPTFDPTNSIIPFPNDLVLIANDAGEPQVQLPTPAGATGLEILLIGGLNTLDGFSTSAPVVTQNGPLFGHNTGVLTDDAKLDGTSLDGGVVFMKLAGGYSQPTVLPCLSDSTDSACTPYFSTVLPDGGTPPVTPQQLILAPTYPLDERAQYAAALTTDLKDSHGLNIATASVFALLRLQNPVLDSDGHSTVIGVSDAQALQLEPVRLGLQPFFTALESAGLQRTKLALAWSFTTQSVNTALQAYHDLPAASGTAKPVFLQDVTDPVTTHPVGVLSTTNFPYSPDGGFAVSKVYFGEVTMENHLVAGFPGALDPATSKPERAYFFLTIPKSAPPASGYPVAIFGHGLGQWAGDMMLIADRFAQAGIATISADDLYHGNRSTCAGAGASTPFGTDNATCAVGTCDENAAHVTYGTCVNPTTPTVCTAAAAGLTGEAPDFICYSQRKGFCLSDGGCSGGDFVRNGDLDSPPADPLSEGAGAHGAAGRPAIAGWNFLDTVNLFRTRDDFRQTTIDYAQVYNLIASTGTGTLNDLLGANALDPANVQYIGQSLGGITGGLYVSVAPEIHNAVLNVPGGDLPNVLLQSPSFVTQSNAFIALLQSQGILRGTPAFDQFVGTAKWILDPGDPVNTAFGLQHTVTSTPPSDRHTFVYYIEQDQTVPNVTTATLLAAANRPGDANACTVLEEQNTPAGVLNTTDEPLAGRHAFMLVPPSSSAAAITLTIGAQTHAADFLSTGTP